MLKRIIGKQMTFVGARLWNLGGFWKANDYSDLTMIGRFGYSLMCRGLSFAGITKPEIQSIIGY